MKTKTYFLSLLFTLSISFMMKAQDWQTPVINGYGKVVDYPKAAVQPDAEKEYKILFHITTDKEKGGVNLKLWKIARLINLMGLRDVPTENVHVIAVISGPATSLVLNNKAHNAKMGTDNPNLDLLKKLTDCGVRVEVCGQAIAERKINAKTDLNAFTTLTLSALIDIPTYQMEGYVPMF